MLKQTRLSTGFVKVQRAHASSDSELSDPEISTASVKKSQWTRVRAVHSMKQ
jgi:hypothetical protein